MKSGYTIILNFDQLLALYECLLSAKSWHSTMIETERESMKSAIARNDEEHRENTEYLLNSYKRYQKNNSKLCEAVEWFLRSLRDGNTVLDIKEDKADDN